MRADTYVLSHARIDSFVFYVRLQILNHNSYEKVTKISSAQTMTN